MSTKNGRLIHKYSTIGVIAGSGTLPEQVVKACLAAEQPFFILALKGYTNPSLVHGLPHSWIRLGAMGYGLRILKQAGVSELVLAGSVYRPSLLEICPDKRALSFLSKIGLKALGDNALLTALIEELEIEGFHVIGVTDIVKEIVAPLGLSAGPMPDEQAFSDINRGIEVSRMLGFVDVGQCAVVQQGLVLAVETVEGTDAMLKRCQALSRLGPGGVLVKLCKPGQEHRADMPTIGPTTVSNTSYAGLRGIAVEAGKTLLVSHQILIDRANQMGLFVIGITLD